MAGGKAKSWGAALGFTNSSRRNEPVKIPYDPSILERMQNRGAQKVL